MSQSCPFFKPSWLNIGLKWSQTLIWTWSGKKISTCVQWISEGDRSSPVFVCTLHICGSGSGENTKHVVSLIGLPSIELLALSLDHIWSTKGTEEENSKWLPPFDVHTCLVSTFTEMPQLFLSGENAVLWFWAIPKMSLIDWLTWIWHPKNTVDVIWV